MKSKKTYEEQKQELIDISEMHFGQEYFTLIEKLIKEIPPEEHEENKYYLTVNHKGAFYACEE